MEVKEINKKNPSLAIEHFAKLQKIFIEKGWPIEEPFEDNVFNNFCKMLASLEENQKELILSLTEDFLWIKESEYMRDFASSFDLFIHDYSFDRGKKIIICPLLPEDDFGKPKSAVVLMYFVKVSIQAIQKKYSDFTISYVFSPEEVLVDWINKDYTLCLIDDFIGTGNTAKEGVNYFVGKGIPITNISIVTIASMVQGVEKLVEEGYAVYSNIKCKKGISETENALEEKQIMKSIEDKIKVDDDYRFGYGSSEALIKVIHTPNNTFPVYWLRKNNEYAPFPR